MRCEACPNCYIEANASPQNARSTLSTCACNLQIIPGCKERAPAVALAASVSNCILMRGACNTTKPLHQRFPSCSVCRTAARSTAHALQRETASTQCWRYHHCKYWKHVAGPSSARRPLYIVARLRRKIGKQRDTKPLLNVLLSSAKPMATSGEVLHY